MTVIVLIQNELFAAQYLVEIHAYGREITKVSPPPGHLPLSQAVAGLPHAGGNTQSEPRNGDPARVAACTEVCLR